MNSYTDTRAKSYTNTTLGFRDVVVNGIADTGGLYVPLNIPTLSLDEITSLAEVPYATRASRIYKRFEVDLDDQTIDALMQRAYGNNFDDDRIAPVKEIVAGTYVMELWHGPTSAFKDMALQCMPLFFSASIDSLREEGRAQENYLILVATSGDTGKAALEGFANTPNIAISVLYPDGGVSDIQRKQMVTQKGDNVAVFGVRGNFDDCQNAVKSIFADTIFESELMHEKGYRLSSANSINWGRLLPQIVYYVSAYADLVAQGALSAGEKVDVCVPTGNFGNILAAYYAREMGVPIASLICASNENHVLTDFINTGTYDISHRTFSRTPSPSMDILISSNLERLLFELTGRDGQKIEGWMNDLKETGRFQIDEDTFAKVRQLFVSDFITNDETLSTIKRVFDDTGYLLDPHTAVAWEVGERLRSDRPLLIVSTAHWAKFGEDVARALLGLPAGANMPEEYSHMTGAKLNEAITRIAPSASAIPMNLAYIDQDAVRFTVTLDADHDSIAYAIRNLDILSE